MVLGGIPAWGAGALICLFGSTLTALGLVLQKHSHIVSELAGDGTVAYFLQRWWICGFCIFLSAQIINMVAMAMTPQVVLSCLGSWTLVCNSVFARLILKESLPSAQALAIAGLVVATALVLYYAPRPDSVGVARYTALPELVGRFLSPEFEVLTTSCLGLVCLARALAVGVPQALRANSCTADLAARQHEYRILAPLSWAIMAAIAAGYTALFFKCIAEIVAGAIAQPEGSVPPWCCWETYFIVVVALSCAPTELHCLNLALQTGEAVFVVPTYLTLGMLAQLATGAIFFQEFRNFHSRSHALGFSFSVLLTIIFVISMAKIQGTDRDDCGTKQAAAPALRAKLLPEPLTPELLDYIQTSASPEQHRPSSSASPLLPPRSLTPRFEQRVSIAGFGGAIECLEVNRGRGRTWGQGKELGSKYRTRSSPI